MQKQEPETVVISSLGNFGQKDLLILSWTPSFITKEVHFTIIDANTYCMLID